MGHNKASSGCTICWLLKKTPNFEGTIVLVICTRWSSTPESFNSKSICKYHNEEDKKLKLARLIIQRSKQNHCRTSYDSACQSIKGGSQQA
jgi:hypothetical protein